jgi:hypothetical protein
MRACGSALRLPLAPRREEEAAHARREAHADRVHRRVQVLHRVVDREPRRDAAARRVDVQEDVAVLVVRLEEEQLRDDDVRDVVIDRCAEEDDAVHQQAREDVIAALAAAGALDDRRHVDRHGCVSVCVSAGVMRSTTRGAGRRTIRWRPSRPDHGRARSRWRRAPRAARARRATRRPCGRSRMRSTVRCSRASARVCVTVTRVPAPPRRRSGELEANPLGREVVPARAPGRLERRAAERRARTRPRPCRGAVGRDRRRAPRCAGRRCAGRRAARRAVGRRRLAAEPAGELARIGRARNTSVAEAAMSTDARTMPPLGGRLDRISGHVTHVSAPRAVCARRAPRGA